ncbi:MAG TPA: HD domain-containing protein [Armatimonadota bacterium]
MTEIVRNALGGFVNLPVWVVGGAVRDWALGRPAKDIDLAIDGDAAAFGREIACSAGGHFFVMHPASQTARVAFADGAWLDIVPLPLGLDADLKRRDFTVNAMALPLDFYMQAPEPGGLPPAPPSQLADPTGGWSDLGERIIRVTHPRVFEEDPLRTLRGLRLLATLGGSHIQTESLALLRDAAPLLSTTSPERLRDEWLSTLDVPDGGRAVLAAAEMGLLDSIVPQWRDMVGVTQNPYHHLDVWDHTLAVLREFDGFCGSGGGMPGELQGPVREYLREYVSPPHSRRALLRLAILLHDSGKPETRSEDEEGRIRFLSHEHTSEGLARSWAVRHRLSGRERAFLGAVVGLHMRPGGLLAPEVSTRAVTRFFRDAGPAAPALLLLNVADRLAARGPWTTDEEVETQVEGSWRLLGQWVEMKNTVALPLPISGKDLMEAFVLSPGPRIGRIIQALRDVHAETPFADRESALEAARQIVNGAEDTVTPPQGIQ